jgi:hypothetical protein
MRSIRREHHGRVAAGSGKHDHRHAIPRAFIVETALAREQDDTYGFSLRFDHTIRLSRVRVIQHRVPCAVCQETAKRNRSSAPRLRVILTSLLVAPCGQGAIGS